MHHGKGRGAIRALIVMASGLVAAGPVGATNLAGPLSGVFTATGSPYLVTADVSVAVGDTARFEAGCELVFSGSAFDVFGRLEVAGTSAQPVIFRSGEAVPAPGDWAGVTFFQGGEGDWDHFEVRHAETGVYVLVGSGTFDDGKILDSADYGFRADVSACIATRLTVERAGQSNPGFTGIFSSGGSPTFDFCEIRDCAGSGVGVFAPAAPLFRDCLIEACRSGVTCVGVNARFERCTIRNHGFAGDFDTGAGFFVGFPNGTPVVVDCVIENNFFGVAIINDGNIQLGDLGDADPTNDGGNLFRANDAFDGTIRHVFNETANPVKAEGNAWTDALGVTSTNLATIDGWILDDDEAVGAAVDFDPLSTATSVAVSEATRRWTLSPNPARGDAVWLSGVLPGRGTVEIDIVDVAGRRRAELMGFQADERVSRRLPLSDVPAGVYFVRVRHEGRDSEFLKLVRTR